MASVSDIAKGFTISGLIDADARTRERFRVVEIPVAEIEDHPANVAYSMDEEGIRDLAASIRKDGITDLKVYFEYDIPFIQAMNMVSRMLPMSGSVAERAYAMLGLSK